MATVTADEDLKESAEARFVIWDAPTVKVEAPSTADSKLRGVVEKLARKDGARWKIDEDAKAKLEELGPKQVETLLPMFADKSADVRRGAAYHLLPFAASSDDLAQGYAGLLDDEDAAVRGIALGAMGQVKLNQRATAAEQIAAVLARTGDDDGQQRATAARLLSDLGKLASPMLPQLTKAASSDASPKVRSASLLAIAKIAEPAKGVKIFVASLDDQDPAVRLVAAQRLRELGRDAAPAADQLGKLLESSDEKLRKAAAEGLVRIGSTSVPILTAALESKSRDTREVAALALGKMGPVARPALSALKKLLKDSDAQVKEQAQIAIAAIESM